MLWTKQQSTLQTSVYPRGNQVQNRKETAFKILESSENEQIEPKMLESDNKVNKMLYYFYSKLQILAKFRFNGGACNISL